MIVLFGADAFCTMGCWLRDGIIECAGEFSGDVEVFLEPGAVNRGNSGFRSWASVRIVHSQHSRESRWRLLDSQDLRR